MLSIFLQQLIVSTTHLIKETGYQLYSFLFWIVIISNHWEPKKELSASTIEDIAFNDDNYACCSEKSLHDSDGSTLVDEEESMPLKLKSCDQEKRIKTTTKTKLVLLKSSSKKASSFLLRRFSASTEIPQNAKKSVLPLSPPTKKSGNAKPRISFLRRKTLPDIHHSSAQ